jgi:hypothetical protein
MMLTISFSVSDTLRSDSSVYLPSDGERFPGEPPHLDVLDASIKDLKRRATATLKRVKDAENAGL